MSLNATASGVLFSFAFAAVLVVAFLAGCATPVVLLKNEATGQIARCGGGAAGSMAGGLIGYNIEQSQDERCDRDFESRGFKRLGLTASPASASETSIVALPTPAPSPQPTAAPTGRDSFTAERVARDAKCNATALASLVAKGAGYETFTIQCTNGEVMMIRCEFGNCRALK